VRAAPLTASYDPFGVCGGTHAADLAKVLPSVREDGYDLLASD
jgi:hypothetical protein